MRQFYDRPTGILIHHSLTKDSDSCSSEAIRRYHKTVNGWDDCGYHYIVERINGKYWPVSMRSTLYEGAHCPRVNATHLGVCLVGDFDVDTPDTEALDALLALVIGLLEAFDLEPVNVQYHSDYSEKTCPGLQFPQTGFLLRLANEWGRRRRV